MNQFDLILKLYNLFEVGGPPTERGIPYTSFGIESDPISIIGGDKVLLFNRIISQLYSKDRDILQSYSRNTFQKKLIDFIRPLKLLNEAPKKEQVQYLYDSLLSIDIREFRVFREIYGITLRKSSNSLNLGNFNIYSFNLYKDMNIDILGKSLELLLEPKAPEYIIEYVVKSREELRAIEIADDYFKRFVLFLKFMIGTNDERFEVGILDFMGSRGRSAIVLSEDKCFFSSERYGSYELIPLDDDYFRNKDAGYDVLWNYIDKNNINSLEKRILTAIEWIGRSLFEKTIQAAFIKASVALESIFTYSEKSIINPSILSQISESVALICKSSPEEGIKIESQIKELYKIRSGIIHAGDKDIDKSDYNRFVQYIRWVITILLTNLEMSKCSSVEDLHNVLKYKKYT